VGYVFQGTLTYIFENGEEISVGPDESYALESEEAHGAVNYGDEDVIGVDIFYPARLNPDWADD